MNSKKPKIVLLSLFLATLGQAARAAPQLTQQQAIQRAADFCRAIGSPVDGPATATFPARADWTDYTGTGASIGSYWLPRWRVSFPRKAEVELVDATGLVTLYNNDILLGSSDVIKIPAVPPVSEADAIQRAMIVFGAAGQPFSELSFNVAQLEQSGQPPIPSRYHWRVIWDRSVGGATYEYQYADVTIQPLTGEILSEHLRFPSPPLAHFVVNLAPTDSAFAVIKRVRALNLPLGPLTNVRLEVVHENNQWQVTPPEPRYNQDRVVWTCRWQDARSRTRFWVDAETGRIVGGDIAVAAGPAAASPSLALAALQQAKEIQVFGHGTKTFWSEKPAATLGTRNHPEILKHLQASQKLQANAPLAIASARLVINGEGQKPLELFYLSKEGLLGAGQEFLVVPAPVKAWLDGVLPKTKAAGTAPLKR